MELLKEITQKDIDSATNEKVEKYTLRKAGRSIVFNNEGKIALLYVSKNNYHKLPGGGVEEGEDVKIALAREMLEEVGADTETLGEIGIVIEYRNDWGLLQISYCYYSKVVGKLKETEFTQTELDAGFMLKWVDLGEAVKLLEKDEPNNFLGKCIRERDLTFLEKAVEMGL